MFFCVLHGTAQVKPVIDKIPGEGMRLESFQLEADCALNSPTHTSSPGLMQWETRINSLLLVRGNPTTRFAKCDRDKDFEKWHGLPGTTEETTRWPGTRKNGKEFSL